MDLSPVLRQPVKRQYSANGGGTHGLSRRKFTREFKLEAVRRLEQGESVVALARALEVNPNLLHRWRIEYRQGPATAFPGQERPGREPDRVAQLERKIGQQDARCKTN